MKNSLNKSTHRAKFSAHAVASDQNKLNVLLKTKPKKIYDSDMDFIDEVDRKETKLYSQEILTLIIRAKKKGISGANIRRKTDPAKVRMWDAAISLLCDDIEISNVTIPHFRHSPRVIKELPTRKSGNTHIFNKAIKPESQYPTGAIGKEFR